MRGPAPVPRWVAAGLLSVTTGVAPAVEPPVTPPPEPVLLTDSLGRTVAVPASAVPSKLLPGVGVGLARQVPKPAKGAPQARAVRKRIDAAQAPGFRLFPDIPPPLAPYLASLDELGNTTVSPGPLVDFFPLEPPVQRAKYDASDVGFRYLLQQTVSGSGVSQAAASTPTLGYYTLHLFSKWAVYADAATAGWLSAEIGAKAGLDAAGRSTTPQTAVGSLTAPTGIVALRDGFDVPELAWQQSFRRGEVVLLAGVIDQANYLDGNAYANNGRGQFVNSALVNSMVLPLPAFDFGLNVQWQPAERWYAILGLSAGNAGPGETPWKDFSWSQWSAEAEFGWMPEDVLGLGPGVYRVQPFLAEAGGPTQGGVAVNVQQQLGARSPFGWFGRFGVGGAAVSGGARAQVGTGFVVHAPLDHLGWVGRLTNDLFGAGFVWSRPSDSTKTVYHRNEYVLEAFYTLQLSPATRIEPDIQVFWNPVFSPDPGPSVVAQIEMIVAW